MHFEGYSSTHSIQVRLLKESGGPRALDDLLEVPGSLEGQQAGTDSKERGREGRELQRPDLAHSLLLPPFGPTP